MTEPEPQTNMYFGTNHDEVVAFLEWIPTIEPGQWGARMVLWSAQELADREVLADHASIMAIKWGYVGRFDLAGERAWESAATAIPPLFLPHNDPKIVNEYVATAASEASLAAQALVVRPFLTPEYFDKLFFPMNLAGFEPARLVGFEGPQY